MHTPIKKASASYVFPTVCVLLKLLVNYTKQTTAHFPASFTFQTSTYSCIGLFCQPIFKRKLFYHMKMELSIYLQLIVLITLNIISFISGAVLNTMVIIIIMKSSHLRKKLSSFMVLVLSCFDLLAVLTYTTLLMNLITWLTENYDLLTRLEFYRRLQRPFSGFSLLALVVMCFERYLGAAYPVFHRTSVTRRRILICLSILHLFPITLMILSINDLAFSAAAGLGIFIVVVVPPFIFVNYKLFKISKKMRRKNTLSPETRKISLKNTSTCLLVVACLCFFSIPSCVYVTLSMVKGSTKENKMLSLMWVGTTFLMNCSFNSLIFFWKNSILRTEGIRILKNIKERIF